MHVILGDDNGGPYAHVQLGDIPKDAEDLTDEEVAESREAAQQLYRDAYGEDAASCVVYVEDNPTPED